MGTYSSPLEQHLAQFGSITSEPLSKLQVLSAEQMTKCWTTPHVTHHDALDITALEALRAGVEPQLRASILSFVIKALAAVLREFPRFNASLDHETSRLILKQYIHIGIAIDTPRGLLVGVLRDSDGKSVEALTTETAALAAKARAKGLSMAEMQGATFTVSSLGKLGGTGFTPIINSPEVAILGISNTQERPARTADGLRWQTVLPVSLSYDHRVVNGADAGRLLSRLGQLLGQPHSLR